MKAPIFEDALLERMWYVDEVDNFNLYFFTKSCIYKQTGCLNIVQNLCI